uniref:5-formyltetrahydrofolate cyclo-ligase n=1 Tax=Ananas comosus var. bracteatus TaxID=296719 RepID=A0A6V7QB41_ANACO|nr:unnamed protein product [Ananas comosus var. bracteatus]
MAHLVPTLSSPPPSPCPALPRSAAITTTTNTTTVAAGMSKSIPDQKRALRSDVRKALKAFSPALRAQEDLAIQNIVLNSSWFKSSTRLCAYISCQSLREVDTSRILGEILKSPDDGHQTQVKKELYVPWVEDKNSNMRMLKISSIEDLVANSMNILEPSPVDANGNQHEDVMLAANPVDLFLLPGLAFDRHGRRLGRGGGYYDVFLKKYQKLATENNWNQPLLVALAYSVQIMEEGKIPVTPCDVPIDALVSATGVIPISPSALERM